MNEIEQKVRNNFNEAFEKSLGEDANKENADVAIASEDEDDDDFIEDDDE